MFVSAWVRNRWSSQSSLDSFACNGVMEINGGKTLQSEFDPTPNTPMNQSFSNDHLLDSRFWSPANQNSHWKLNHINGSKLWNNVKHSDSHSEQAAPEKARLSEPILPFFLIQPLMQSISRARSAWHVSLPSEVSKEMKAPYSMSRDTCRPQKNYFSTSNVLHKTAKSEGHQ